MRKDSKKQLEKELRHKADIGMVRLNFPNMTREGLSYWKGYMYSVQTISKEFGIEINGVTNADFNRY